MPGLQSPPEPSENTRQERQARREAIRLKKIAYITQEMDLTPEEAEKFWPLYNAMEKEHIQLMKHRHGLLKKIHSGFDTGEAALSEEELRKLLADYDDLYLREGALRKRYFTRYSSFLSTEKIARLYVAEERFNDQLLRDFFAKRANEHHK